ncbi:hypothetical protein EMCRGX_G026337 [Ephydatia muelleri]
MNRKRVHFQIPQEFIVYLDYDFPGMKKTVKMHLLEHHNILQKNEILCSKQLVEELRAKLQVAAAEKDNAQTQLRAYVEAEAANQQSLSEERKKNCELMKLTEQLQIQAVELRAALDKKTQAHPVIDTKDREKMGQLAPQPDMAAIIVPEATNPSNESSSMMVIIEKEPHIPTVPGDDGMQVCNFQKTDPIELPMSENQYSYRGELNLHNDIPHMKNGTTILNAKVKRDDAYLRNKIKQQAAYIREVQVCYNELCALYLEEKQIREDDKIMRAKAEARVLCLEEKLRK